MIPADEALAMLRDGNRRFVAGIRDRESRVDPGYREGLIAFQRPIAAVLGCADSRVQSEVLFQQCSGHLFVTRVAGAVAGPSAIGSIEFALDTLGVRLVVVLGHSWCGAVTAALDPAVEGPPHLRPILHQIRHALGGATAAEMDLDDAVRATVHATCSTLQRESELLRRGLESGRVRLVGAHYCIETGVAEFFEDAFART